MERPGPFNAGVDWQTILDQAAGPVAIIDLQGRIVYVNPAGCRKVGRDLDSLLGRTSADFTYPGDQVLDRDAIDAVLAGQRDSLEVEKRFVHSNGRAGWTLIVHSLIRDAHGRPLFFFSQIHDTTAWREAELLWQRTVANAPIGMALLDLTGRWTKINDKLCELLGYHRDELVGMHYADLTYPGDRDEEHDPLAELLDGRRDMVEVEKRYRHKDGHPFWMLIRISVMPDPSGRPDYLVSQYETIGDGRIRDSHLAHLALHDPLTGLANRTLLTDRLAQALAKLADGNSVLALLVVDLDNMKPVNDTYGHPVGDQLLITTADELLKSVRVGDTVARIGGDEFVVLARTDTITTAEALRDRISTRLHTELTADGHTINLSASVGLATTQNPLTPADALLTCADDDMYRQKKNKPDSPIPASRER